MSIIDEVVDANQGYARKFELGTLAMPPSRKLAIVACMDARMTVEQMLGLKTGEAHIIRNAGGLITEDALRSLIISHYLLGTREFMIINHTDCGMLSFQDSDLHDKLRTDTGVEAIVPASFGAFRNVEENVRRQVLKLRSHPWVPRDIPVRGFVYDVHTGKLNEVAAGGAATRTA